jgi:hypothetical protein
MIRHRPTAVLVIAILNMVWGAFGLMGLVCGGLSLLLVRMNPQLAGGNAGIQDFDIPGYVPFAIVSAALSLVLAFVLISAGIGLLRMRPWARWCSLAYAVANILIATAGLILQLTYFNPAAAELAAQAAPGKPPNPFASQRFRDVAAVGGAALGMAYAVALLIVLCLPHVRAAFAGHSPAKREPEDYRDPE